MAIKTGGIFGEFGPAQAAHTVVMRQIGDFAPAMSEDDFVVDIAFYTGSDRDTDPPPIGVTPGAVGRAQRRFIVWHRLPQRLVTETAVREWFVANLTETERLVREYLPTKSKKYPAEDLALQVRALRDALREDASRQR